MWSLVLFKLCAPLMPIAIGDWQQRHVWPLASKAFSDVSHSFFYFFIPVFIEVGPCKANNPHALCCINITIFEQSTSLFDHVWVLCSLSLAVYFIISATARLFFMVIICCRVSALAEKESTHIYTALCAARRHCVLIFSVGWLCQRHLLPRVSLFARPERKI